MDEALAMKQVSPMLHLISNRFAHKFGLCREEIFQEIQLTALRAIRTHVPGKRTLLSWVVMLTHQTLYRQVKKRSWRERFGKGGGVVPDQSKELFSLEKLLLEVSQDAATAIQLAIQEGVADRLYIETVLSVSYNWTREQISKTFHEIQEALQ